MKLHTLFSIVLSLIFVQYTTAQEIDIQPNPIKVWQLSGLTLEKKTETPIPFTRIEINHSRRGLLTNEDGFYSIPVEEGDTVYFYCLGYKPSKLIVKDYLSQKPGSRKTPYLYAITYMREDSYTIPEVRIYPYQTAEALRIAALNMEIPQNTPEQIAKDNLNPQIIAQIMSTMPLDAGERVGVAQQLYYQQYQSQRLARFPTIDLIGAAKLLQYVAQKIKARRTEGINDWEE